MITLILGNHKVTYPVRATELSSITTVDISFMNRIIDVNSPISADMMSAGAIYDVLCMREQKNTNFTSDELNQLLSFFLS